MTRINLIHPSKLSDKHLLAEYRELPRIFTLAHDAMYRDESPDDPRNPTEYRLGPGHVRFFYPRLGFLAARFLGLVDEMHLRGWSPAHITVHQVYHVMPNTWRYDYTPTPEALSLNLERLRARDPEHYRDHSV